MLNVINPFVNHPFLIITCRKYMVMQVLGPALQLFCTKALVITVIGADSPETKKSDRQRTTSRGFRGTRPDVKRVIRIDPLPKTPPTITSK